MLTMRWSILLHPHKIVLSFSLHCWRKLRLSMLRELGQGDLVEPKVKLGLLLWSSKKGPNPLSIWHWLIYIKYGSFPKHLSLSFSWLSPFTSTQSLTTKFRLPTHGSSRSGTVFSKLEVLIHIWEINFAVQWNVWSLAYAAGLSSPDHCLWAIFEFSKMQVTDTHTHTTLPVWQWF